MHPFNFPARFFVFFIIFLFRVLPVPAQEYRPTPEDLQFLDLVQRKAFDFFLNEHHPETGLVKDKADNFSKDSTTIASIAATGFGLTAMVVGAERGWVSKEEARRTAVKTLRFFLNQMENERGFFYHFVHWETGKPIGGSELSSIDTALFLAGALTAGEYFKGTEVEELARKIYERVDFPWMLNGGKTLSMGWLPGEGFLKSRWDQYNESLILYVLATGSPTFPIPSGSWRAVRKPIGTYDPYVLIYSPPLFTHQYSAVWVDLRDQNDGLADYFENSRIATLANRQFCIDHRQQFETYSEDIWGLTASLSPQGYKAYGAEPGGALHDGTVAPTAAGSSIVFTPELSLKALRAIHEQFEERIWGKYGFADSFNVDRNWYARYVLGIDQGPILLMAENYRSELIWNLFMRHDAVRTGMKRIGFQPGTLSVKLPERPRTVIVHTDAPVQIDGDLEEWAGVRPLELVPSEHRELGEFTDERDLSVKLFLAWDEVSLYVGARVLDESVVARRKGDQIWRDDCLEFFVDPEENGLRWGDPRDVQLGMSPGEGASGLRMWAWFQRQDPLERDGIQWKIKKQAGGFDLEAKIPWDHLKLSPKPGRSFGFTPAFHDLDQDGTEGKLIWYFIREGKRKRERLGEAVWG